MAPTAIAYDRGEYFSVPSTFAYSDYAYGASQFNRTTATVCQVIDLGGGVTAGWAAFCPEFRVAFFGFARRPRALRLSTRAARLGLGGAIGGTVNVRSLSAFDRDGGTFSVAAEGGYNGLVEEFSPKLSGSYTSIFGNDENFGIAIAASWFDRDFGSDNIESGGWPDDLETVGGQTFKGAEEIEQRSYTVNRERIGLAANLDWRSDRSQFYWRNLYSEFSDQEYRMRNEFKFDDGDAVSGDSSSAQWQDAVIEKSMKDRLEEQTILSSVLGGEHYVNQWTFDYAYGYSFSQEEVDTIEAFTAVGRELGVIN